MDNNNWKTLKEAFNEILKDGSQPLSDDAKKVLTAYASATDPSLERTLPDARDYVADCDTRAGECGEQAKAFGEQKKSWQERSRAVRDWVGDLLHDRGEKSLEAGGAKAGITIRTNIVITDEEGLLSQYTGLPQTEALLDLLPDWVRVTFSIDRNALRNALKEDPSLLYEHPEWLHTENNETITLK